MSHLYFWMGSPSSPLLRTEMVKFWSSVAITGSTGRKTSKKNEAKRARIALDTQSGVSFYPQLTSHWHFVNIFNFFIVFMYLACLGAPDTTDMSSFTKRANTKKKKKGMLSAINTNLWHRVDEIERNGNKGWNHRILFCGEKSRWRLSYVILITVWIPCVPCIIIVTAVAASSSTCCVPFYKVIYSLNLLLMFHCHQHEKLNGEKNIWRRKSSPRSYWVCIRLSLIISSVRYASVDDVEDDVNENIIVGAGRKSL